MFPAPSLSLPTPLSRQSHLERGSHKELPELTLHEPIEGEQTLMREALSGLAFAYT